MYLGYTDTCIFPTLKTLLRKQPLKILFPKIVCFRCVLKKKVRQSSSKSISNFWKKLYKTEECVV